MPDHYITRRRFIRNSVITATGIILVPNFISCSKDPVDEDFNAKKDDLPSFSKINFESGIASFDPGTTSVIIWTRYSTQKESVPVVWELADNPDFDPVLRTGEVITDTSRDHTLAIEVLDLEPGGTYFYRFMNLEDKAVSDTGRTMTFPSNAGSVKIAVCSCAHYEAGYFNVYKAMAQSDADVIVHLGDYIYETAPGQTGGISYPENLNRTHQPAKETISLSDYRERYRQYRSDPNLQQAHKQKAFICIWDDHEIANGAWKNGAQNHSNSEGDFQLRKKAAVQAYSEYLPVSTSEPMQIYRTIQLGDLVDLHMMDTRLIGREKQLSYRDYLKNEQFDFSGFKEDLFDEGRSMLGLQQRNWLVSQVNSSSAKWNVLAQQGLMSKIMIPAEAALSLDKLWAEISENGGLSTETASGFQQQLTELLLIKAKYLAGNSDLTDEEFSRITRLIPYNLDAWDGYPAEREYLYNAFSKKGLVSIAGSTHNAWYNELRAELKGGIGKEFATASVSSPGFEGLLKQADKIDQFEQGLQFLVDDLNFLNASERGFLKLKFTQAEVQAEWIFVESVTAPGSSSHIGHTEIFGGI